MKILFLCDVLGGLGDWTRAAKIYGHLESRHEQVRFINIASKYRPKSRILLLPDVATSIVMSRLRGEDLSLTRWQARMKIAKKVLKAQTAKFHPDLIWCEGELTAAAAVDTADQATPIVTDVHGIASAEYETSAGSLADTRVTHLYEQMEDRIFSGSWRIVVVSNAMKSFLVEERGVDPNKLFVVHNGSEARTRTAQYGWPLKVIYAGNFASWENVDSYLDLAKLCHEHLFYLAGYGPLERRLLGRIGEERIPIRYLGRLQYCKTMDLFSEMNVGVAPSVDTLARKVAWPIKVFDYLSCGLPVITPDFGEWARVIAESRCGFVTETSDAKEFAECLASLDRSTWEEMSMNALRLIRHRFNWNALLRETDKILNPLS